jgi:hypothetical protein
LKKSVERMVRFCQKRSCERVHPLRGGETGEAITAPVNPPDVRVTEFFWPLKRELGFGAYAPDCDTTACAISVGTQFESEEPILCYPLIYSPVTRPAAEMVCAS